MTTKRFLTFFQLGVACAAVAPFAGAQELLYTVDGEAEDVHLGISVAGAGDLNADGYPDYLIGAPGADLRKVRGYSGQDGSLLFSMFGESTTDGFGYSVAGLGDVDLDGFDDFGVTAYPTGGYARVYSGRDQTQLYHWDGSMTRIIGAGDVNADGHPDVAAAFPSGVRIFSGQDGSTLDHFSEPVAPIARSLAAAGDVNADGYADIIVGSFFESSGHAENGVARVYSGQDGSILHHFSGEDSWEWFGSGVAGIGDVDLDGHDDVLVIAKIEFLLSFLAPYFRVYSGQTGTLLAQVPLEACLCSGLEGQAAVGTGDVTGDGVPDFMISGRPSFSDPQFVALYSGADFTRLWTLQAPAGDGSLDVIGDADGDGALEFITGSRFAHPNGDQSGSAEVRRVLCAPPPTHFCTGAPNSAGPGAMIDWSGSRHVSDNSLELVATGCAPSAFGVFYYGPEQIQTPFGDGFQCVGPGGTGVFRLDPPIQTNGQGDVALSLDFTEPPMNAGPGRIEPGATWHFQYWFRDVPAMMSGFNLTDGLSVTLCP